MKTLKTLSKLTNEYLTRNFGTSEFDMSINDISRMKIKAMKEEYGTCFMYPINKWKETEPSCVEYTGQEVYNFEFAVIMPEKNDELIAIIDERNRPKEGRYDGNRNMAEVESIFNIVEKSNGIILFWA